MINAPEVRPIHELKVVEVKERKFYDVKLSDSGTYRLVQDYINNYHFEVQLSNGSQTHMDIVSLAYLCKALFSIEDFYVGKLEISFSSTAGKRTISVFKAPKDVEDVVGYYIEIIAKNVCINLESSTRMFQLDVF